MSTTRLLVVLILLALLAPAAGAAEIPQSLRDIVMGARHRPVVETKLDGVAFHGLARSSNLPFLLWPTDESGVTLDPDKAGGWLDRSAAALGLGEFRARYVETFSWRGNDVRAYVLVRQGIVLHDLRIMLHWRDGRLIGIVNEMPSPVLHVDAAKTGPDEQVYTPRRVDGGFALRLARLRRETRSNRTETTIEIANETIRRIVEPIQSPAGGAAAFEEWAVPQGTFPDQIDIDSNGLVWFSQPNNNWVTSFDRASATFTRYTTTGGAGPDGMMVDRNDVLWTGLYNGNSGLGRFAIPGSDFTSLPATYSPVNMAIPNEMTSGTIWITDHLNNRISEFDPVTNTWLQSLEMPTASCWVVGGTEDPVHQDAYFTEYNVDQLGLKPLIGPIQEIDTPVGGGPAFAVYSDGFVYFSQWNLDRLGAYEIATGIITEYAFPVANELGGPIDATPGGRVAVGTRNTGYIMVFDPVTSSFDAHPIPTTSPGLKDGLRADGNETIWFTETFANRIAVLDLYGPQTGTDFSGTPRAGTAPLSVDFTDESANFPVSWSWDFGDTGNSSVPDPTHIYSSTGQYPVSLTVMNMLGGSTTETKIDYINVFTPCAIGPGDVTILGRRHQGDAIFDWGSAPNCRWDVHRSTDPVDILATPPVVTVQGPVFRDVRPAETLVFYNVVPTNTAP